MTLKEIEGWIHSAKFIVTDYCENDSNGNNYARDIFEKDGKHYAVEYINGKIAPVIDGKTIETSYQLKEVKVSDIILDRDLLAIIV
jgi:hypothetical protein